MQTKRTFLLLSFCFLFVAAQAQKALELWYDKPATRWEETLPLGNGRLGMMPDGGITKENIVLNDITLWSGSAQDANDYNAHQHLPQIQKLLLEGKNDEAEAVMDSFFVCKGPGSGFGSGADVQFGCYQVLGNLELQFAYKNVDTNRVKATHYKRQLSLHNAVATCSYELNGVTYSREYFTSFGNDIGFIRLTASKPRQLHCILSLDRPERFTTTVIGNSLQMKGQLNNGTDGKGMQYIADIRPQIKEGKIEARGNTLLISDATEIIILFSAKTDYQDASYVQSEQRILTQADATSYTSQKQQHIANYQKLFNRVSLQIGDDYNNLVPTDQRLVQFQKDPAKDNGLPVLFFQFGRYLTIASTRVGLLPPNLQGLWANSIQTPWNGDYHLDVNVQMNHWPVEVTNLSELNLPLAELVKNLVPNGEKTAKAYYNAEGWVAHTITNIWGYSEPGESASWGATKAGSGWLCNNLWQHYEFTNDTGYLRSIYPILKGAALFYSSTVVTDPKTGWLVTSPSESPENHFVLPNGKQSAICMGATIDNQIMRELLMNVSTASLILGTDADLRLQFAAQLKNLPPAVMTGSDGRIKEWLEEYKEAEPTHRHISHLYGLYPASLITTEKTAGWAKAAEKSLLVRGDDGPSWSIAYKQIFWARLHDGNHAYQLFKHLMRPVISKGMNYGAGGGMYPNLLSAGPPFQIDANYGGTAAIAEMLLQSHEDFIELLPAIPKEWQASGEVKGLKARGNYTVNFAWKNGRVTRYSITSPQPKPVRVKVNGDMKIIEVNNATEQLN